MQKARQWLASLVAVVLVTILPAVAAAFSVPPPAGAVTDTAGKISAADDGVLEQRIARMHARTGVEMGVLVVGSLGGESIEDVAYRTFNTWGIGKKGTDDGVLLVIAPNERKTRIETGKGIGDRITDAGAARILASRTHPALREGRVADAVLATIEGIDVELGEPGDGSGASTGPKAPAIDNTREELLVGSVLGIVWLAAFAVSFVTFRRRRGPDVATHGTTYAPVHATASTTSATSAFVSTSACTFSGGASGGGGASGSY